MPRLATDQWRVSFLNRAQVPPAVIEKDYVLSETCAGAFDKAIAKLRLVPEADGFLMQNIIYENEVAEFPGPRPNY